MFNKYNSSPRGGVQGPDNSSFPQEFHLKALRQTPDTDAHFTLNLEAESQQPGCKYLQTFFVAQICCNHKILMLVFIILELNDIILSFIVELHI